MSIKHGGKLTRLKNYPTHPSVRTRTLDDGQWSVHGIKRSEGGHRSPHCVGRCEPDLKNADTIIQFDIAQRMADKTKAEAPSRRRRKVNPVLPFTATAPQGGSQADVLLDMLVELVSERLSAKK